MSDNVYMQKIDTLPHGSLTTEGEGISDKAMCEWRQLLSKLTTHGVEVLEFETTDPKLFDAVFPDWIVTMRDENYPDGVLLVFPMRHLSRRDERKPEIINRLRQDYATVIDLSAYEGEELFLEGNGCLRYVRKQNLLSESLRQSPFGSGSRHAQSAEQSCTSGVLLLPVHLRLS
jgi:hypothetical protein